MNSYTRTMAAIYGETYDRTPVIPLIIQHALYIAKIPHREYSTNGSKMAEAQLFALRNYDYDGFHITTDNQIISEVLGCNIFLPFDEPPQYRKRILQDNAELKQLKTGFNPAKDGRMPVVLNATKICREYIKNNFFLKVNCDSGPFSVAAALRGEENFFRDLYDDEQYVYDLLDICTEAVIKYAKAIADSGAHAITFGDSTAGLIGGKMYEKFALPFEQRVIQSIKDIGLPAFMHICGNTRGIIDLMADSGANVLEIDTLTDLPTAYQKTDYRICLEGNIHPSAILLQGTAQSVYDESIKCIRESKGKYLILSSGCEVPRFTPEENIKAMIRAAQETIFNIIP
ncbi:MAG TPA: hypothetical protein DDW65_08210 [Firmicutes bacterium]|jgi:uroporphyrinogen decarboxylase|nr:hypothetical protein [Bacillota bacterium]